MALDDYVSTRPLSDKEWRAREDARTLAMANVISEDPKRMYAAKQAAQRMAEEEQRDASAMKKVAKGQRSKPATEKSVSNFNVFQRLTKGKQNG